MVTSPPKIKQQYSHRLPGVYGEFGAGAGVHAFYLQSALTPAQLGWVSLISDIRGSERWPVRDLFQRDVDNERITESLLPYLQNMEKIKFFNPLTLTLLPMEQNRDRVLTQMPRVVASQMVDGGQEWERLERPEYHRIRWVRENPEYALLEWADTRTRLVAIDGQHRLSALKRFWTDATAAGHKDFVAWRIPVVVVSFRSSAGREEPPSVLEVIRSIFVYINTQAKVVNRARAILLSDESVNGICAQEVVQRAHANDLVTADERDGARAPLLLFDWRGEESEKQRVHAPAAVMRVEEIYDWFDRYLLGEDFRGAQRTGLGLNPTHPLHEAFFVRKLNHQDSKVLRAMIQEDLLPGVSRLLEEFVPYRDYIDGLRTLERKYESHERSDLARHAFYELRFGSNLAPESVKPNVERLLLEIKSEVEGLKKRHLQTLMDLDIGMRGVVCAFGELWKQFDRPGWVDFAKWFVDGANRVYENEWLDLESRSKKREFLRHVVEDHNDTIVNYRLEDASGALGAYVQLLVAAYGEPVRQPWREGWSGYRDEVIERLQTRVIRGYRKEVRPSLRADFPEGGVALTEAVSEKATQLGKQQMRRFERRLDRIKADRSKDEM